jgi:hypothetical protein
MARGNGFRIDIDLNHAEREAARVRELLAALRKRHDLARFEFTQHVRIMPASATHSHPVLTLGTRFADTEDLLLSTYLHEQMHWYLWHLGGPDHDPIAPFFDELVRRYPQAPTRLPEGARNYEQTYLHLVVCWLEVEAMSELVGRERAVAIADTQWGYRWVYRTVIADAEPLGRLYRQHGIVPILSPRELARSGKRRAAASANGARQKMLSGAPRRRRPRSRRTPAARDGRSPG